MAVQSFETYDLKLDQACIFLQPGSPQYINGTFHIYLPQSKSFKGIKLQLLSVLKTPRDDIFIQNDRERITVMSEQNIGSSKCLPSFQLPAGNYEFPFSIPLSGRMLETVTCQRQTYHTYRVEAIIERRFRGNSTISRPIRIYNHPGLGFDHQLISAPVTVERQPDQDLQYSISLPDSKFPFASSFRVKCDFSPLSKNLKIGTVSVSVLERHRLQSEATAAESAMHNVSIVHTSSTATIFQSTHNDTDQILETTAPEEDIAPAEWCLSLPVQLPGSFDLASQSILTRPIQVSHDLAIQAQFHNTETGAQITVEEKIPFSIYMTPAVIDEDGTIHSKDIESFKGYESPPPAYGKHKCDAIALDWAEHWRESSLSCQQQCYQQRDNNGSCIHIPSQGFLGDEPPTYSFLST